MRVCCSRPVPPAEHAPPLLRLHSPSTNFLHAPQARLQKKSCRPYCFSQNKRIPLSSCIGCPMHEDKGQRSGIAHPLAPDWTRRQPHHPQPSLEVQTFTFFLHVPIPDFYPLPAVPRSAAQILMLYEQKAEKLACSSSLRCRLPDDVGTRRGAIQTGGSLPRRSNLGIRPHRHPGIDIRH